jgi:sigma-B regulation protein RsbU (phosphoserine phosphatase)
MQIVELADDPRIAPLQEALLRASRARELEDVLRSVAGAVRVVVGEGAFVWLHVRGLSPGAYHVIRLQHDTGELVRGDWSRSLEVPPGPPHGGGLLGRIVARGRPVLVKDLDLPEDPALGDFAARYRAAMAVPVFLDGEISHWALVLGRDPRAFDETEVAQLMLRANLIGAAAHNHRLATELREANDWIHGEIEQIARLQRALLPETPPRVPGIGIAAHFESYHEAGGDHYDVFPLRRGPDDQFYDLGGPWAFLVADVSGHGPAMAMVAAMVHTIARAYSGPAEPARMLGYLNRHLFEKRLDSTFVTAFLAVYDPETKTLRYARAGHPPALVRQPGGGFRLLRGGAGVPLGVLGDAEYTDHLLELVRGQMVLLYTDGITEARAPDGRFLGVEGLQRALDACDKQAPG